MPACTNPAHAGSKVARAGWYGKSPHRRQRWLCTPANGDPPHRFAELLPRQSAGASHCSECSVALDPWEGQAGARTYLFSAREVGHALALLARGESYRRAAADTRQRAGRELAEADVSGFGLRRPNLDGQLVANWVDVFAPVVLEGALPERWPQSLALDSVEFRTGGLRGPSFHVFVAVGYERPGAKERVWAMRAFNRRDQASWEAFLASLAGTPARIVADMDHTIAGAVHAVFPRGEDPAPDYRWCEFHLRRAIDNVLAFGARDEELTSLTDRALLSAEDFRRFEAALRGEAERVPAAPKWLARYGEAIARQAATRPATGPHSVGAAEATIARLERALDGRAQSLGNRARTDLLLGLLTLGLGGRANERAFAKQVRLHLESRAGRAPRQRPHDDRRGEPSLVS